MSRSQRLSFITTNSCWGGSEELWSQTAARLANKGNDVSVSVPGWWSQLHQRDQELRQSGVDVHVRPVAYTKWHRTLHRISAHHRSLHNLDKFLRRTKPDLVVISNGDALPPIELAELCVARKLRFVSIGQSNTETWWPTDSLAARYRKALSTAVRCYFVSEKNKRLAEKQVGAKFGNAEIIRNPFNVPVDASPPWPAGETAELRLASVGRFDLRAKGQDILLEVLASPSWQTRKWHLTFYGRGIHEECLRRLAAHLRLTSRIEFAGFSENVQDVWAANHALVMSSRLEGLPLAVVEAMMCGRPVIATDVGGQAEVIEEGITGFLANAATVDAFSRALEQAWQRRCDLRRMGQLAAQRIRRSIPEDPVDVLSEKILTIADCKHR